MISLNSEEHQQEFQKRLEEYDDQGNRIYHSVTRIVNSDPNLQRILAMWRRKVGDEEADRISQEAADRGLILHTLIENYLLKKEVDTSDLNENDLHRYNQLVPVLDRVSDIVGIECSLYSDKHKYLGKADLISMFDNLPSVIDFKTSRKKKNRQKVDNYFCQTSSYGKAFEELMGRDGLIKQMVVIVVYDPEVSKTADVFIENSRTIPSHFMKFHNLRKFYVAEQKMPVNDEIATLM